MRIRNPKDKEEVISSCDFFYNGFNNSNPIHLEIGMGKGKFILEMALKYPNVNFIGVEKYSSIASLAIKRIRDIKPNNLRILIMDAENLLEILENKIDTIYLNFSDPWPKDRHFKRRLTSTKYLDVYDGLFKDSKHIIMKTDNDNLFEYSLESFKKHGYIINKISYDLHSENIENVETEYEEKFSKIGIKIKYVDVSK